MPNNQSSLPKKPTRPREKARNEQRSPPPDSKSAAGDTEQQTLSDAVDDLDGRG